MTSFRRVLLAVFLSVSLFAPVSSFAQAPLPNSPAYGVGRRLQKEAEDALAYSRLLQSTGNSSEAVFQRTIAERRAAQAIKKYQEVVSSRTFGHTAAAAEALYQTALLQEHVDRSLNSAVQSLKQLKNNYSGVDYPDKALAHADFTRVSTAIDIRGQHMFPDSICYAIMNFLVALTGGKAYSYWLAILIFSLVVKLALTPLSNKQYASMKEMQKLQPHIKEVQAKHKDNPQKMQEAVMQIYKEHNVNPVAGCGPMLIQIPIMIALYYTIRVYEFQFSKGTFLWIGSAVSHLYPSYLATDLSQMDIPLLLLYALSMYVQQRMTVPPDPQAAEQQRMMAIYTPFLSAYFFLQYKLPSAFVLYYLIFNVLSMAQQYYYMQKRKGDEAPAVATTGKANSWSADSLKSNGTGKSLTSSDGSATKTTGGAKPAARGTIAPKVHPKKKKR